MSRAASNSVKTSPGGRYLTAAIWLSAGLCALHPVSTDRLWWELSKGREFLLSGWDLLPALMVGPTHADATWLSGILPYFAYESFGISGLMFLKLGSVAALTGLLLRRLQAASAGRMTSWSAVLIIAAILASSSAWDPSSTSFDLWGLIAVTLIAEQPLKSGRGRQLLLMACCLGLWANCGPRSAIGLVLCMAWALQQQADLKFRVLACTILPGAACLTPAGWRTPLDSLLITIPQLAESTWVLTRADWHPWWTSPFPTESFAFVIVTLLALVRFKNPDSWQPYSVLIGAHILATASAENLPIAAFWLVLVATRPALAIATTRELAVAKPRTMSGVPANSDRGPVAPPPFDRRGRLGVGVLSIVAGLTLLPQGQAVCGLGWGIDPSIQSEAFAASLASSQWKGTAHCVGWREAGLLSWFAAPRLKPFDTPTSALLNGRLREHVLLTSDLTQGWQVPHRRPDGDWGGWWNIIQSRGITALVIPSENLELIAALEPSLWKPLSLNAVSLVYGKAGDPGCTPQIVQTLSLRQFVDRGVWTYQPASETTGELFEIWSGFDQTVQDGQRLRLARTFRAMQLHIAALKVLEAAPAHLLGATREEFHQNQMALGYRERIHCGRSSELRWLASLLTLSRGSDHSQVAAILNWTAPPPETTKTGILPAVQRYTSGDVSGAAALLTEQSAEVLYAQALLSLERGDPHQAGERLQEFLQTNPTHPLATAAKFLSRSLNE